VIARHSRQDEGGDDETESADESTRSHRDFANRRVGADQDTELARDEAARDETIPRDSRRTKRAALWTENDPANDRASDDRTADDGRRDGPPAAERRKPRKTKSAGFREVGDAQPAGRPSPSRRSGDAALAAELEEIDLALSTMVMRDLGEWDFAPMRVRTEALLSRSETALDRGRIRLVQRKIERYDEIKQRHDTVLSVQAKTDVRNRVLTGGLPAPRSSDALQRFDGVGRLAQVGPGQTGAAGFALLDNAGEVRYYVTPSPGVNLRPYLGREVGVNGTLGFMPDARTSHVTAKRITVVDDRIAR
jgi:hypothetical protein